MVRSRDRRVDFTVRLTDGATNRTAASRAALVELMKKTLEGLKGGGVR